MPHTYSTVIHKETRLTERTHKQESEKHQEPTKQRTNKQTDIHTRDNLHRGDRFFANPQKLQDYVALPHRPSVKFELHIPITETHRAIDPFLFFFFFLNLY